MAWGDGMEHSVGGVHLKGANSRGPPENLNPRQLFCRPCCSSSQKLGWEESWADTITSEMRKRGMPASVHSVQAAFDYLTSVGFTSAEVCNMVSTHCAVEG